MKTYRTEVVVYQIEVDENNNDDVTDIDLLEEEVLLIGSLGDCMELYARLIKENVK